MSFSFTYLNNSFLTNAFVSYFQNNGAQQLASEATVYIMLEDVNDEIPLFTEREQETVLEGEPIGTKVTQVNAIDKDGTFPNNQVCALTIPNIQRFDSVVWMTRMYVGVWEYNFMTVFMQSLFTVEWAGCQKKSTLNANWITIL